MFFIMKGILTQLTVKYDVFCLLYTIIVRRGKQETGTMTGSLSNEVKRSHSSLLLFPRLALRSSNFF